MRAPLRHAVVLAAGGLLLWAFYALRPAALHEVHRWNRAWADASVVLLAAVFLIGPAARIWPRAAAALAWRRELGVWGFVAALVHVAVYAQGAFSWDLARFVQDSEHHGPGGVPVGPLDWRRDAWAAGNWIGIAALLYGVLPLATSNDLSQRVLGKAWKRLQDHGHVLYTLSLLHVFVFWLLVYQPGGQGPAGVVLWTVFGAVAVAEGAALAWWLARRRRPVPAE